MVEGVQCRGNRFGLRELPSFCSCRPERGLCVHLRSERLFYAMLHCVSIHRTDSGKFAYPSVQSFVFPSNGMSLLAIRSFLPL